MYNKVIKLIGTFYFKKIKYWYTFYHNVSYCLYKNIISMLESDYTFFDHHKVIILICLTNTEMIRCEKMKMKRKIMAIWVILLLVAIPLGIAEASETYEKEQDSENLIVELVSVKSDGGLTTEKMFLSEEKVVELENTLSIFLQTFQSAKNWEELADIIDSSIGTSNSLALTILKSYINLRLSKSRAFVISSGHGFNFNPFKKNDLKLRKDINFWHYSSGKLIEDRTIIIQPLALKMKLLTGIQFGFMTRFTGIYIFVSRRLPEKSYTFFMGTARRINGIQVLSGK